MGIEVGNYVNDLNQSWPPATDPVQQGANHLRLIKKVLKQTFPGASGNGFAETISAIEDEINQLVGIDTTKTIQQQLDDLASSDGFPSGTKMIFYQAAPPTGWVYETTESDSMLRCTAAFGGLSGGTDSPVNWSTTHAHTVQDHTLTVSEIPSHTHGVATHVHSASGGLDGGGSGYSKVDTTITSNSQGGGLPHNHGITSTVSLSFTPRYINVIKGVKS